MGKIMILANSILGFKKFRLEIIEKVIDMNNEVIIFCSESNENNNILEIDKIGAKYKQISFNRRTKNPFEDFKLFLKYLMVIKNEKPSVVLTESIKPNVYGGMACRIFKIPYLSNVTGLGTAFEKENFIKKLAIFLYKIGTKDCRCLYFQNQSNLEELIKYLKNVPFKLLPGSGVNLERFKFIPYPKQKDVIIVNYVGRIMYMKGIEEFIYCVKYIKNKYKNVIFRVIGNFDEEKYRKIIMDYDKEGLIQYLGYQNDMKNFIEDSHLIISSSHSEGMSNVLLEHAAMGRPAIASNIPGCKEIIEDGKSGFLFEVKNKYDLIDKVEKFILLEYNEKAKMGKLARKIVEEKFDRNIVVNEYESKIREILSK